jgi:TPR repeat protein
LGDSASHTAHVRFPLAVLLPLLVASMGLVRAEDALADLAKASKLPDVTQEALVAREMHLRTLITKLREADFEGLEAEAQKLLAQAAPEDDPHSPPWRFMLERLSGTKAKLQDAWVTAKPESLAARLVRVEASISRAPFVRRKDGEEAFLALLNQAKKDVEKALALDAKQPRAHARRLTLARGLKETPEVVKPLLAKAQEVSPKDYLATREAVEYWRSRRAAPEVNAILKRLQTDLPGHPTQCRVGLDIMLIQIRLSAASAGKDQRGRVQKARAYMQKVSGAMGALLKNWLAAAPKSCDPFLMQLNFGMLVGARPQELFKAHVEAARRHSLTSMSQVANVMLGDRRSNESQVAGAVKMATMAAVCGNPGGMTQVARALLMGRGVEKSPEQAVKWLELAIRAQDPQALGMLGNCYLQGMGVAKDPAKAKELYSLAARRGNMNALVHLGEMTYQGKDGKKNPQGAARYWSEAAKRGHPTALIYLGQLYAKGEGVAQNVMQAARLYQEAARRGSPKAKKLLQDLIQRHPELQRGGGAPPPGTPPPPPGGGR